MSGEELAAAWAAADEAARSGKLPASPQARRSVPISSAATGITNLSLATKLYGLRKPPRSSIRTRCGASETRGAMTWIASRSAKVAGPIKSPGPRTPRSPVDRGAPAVAVVDTRRWVLRSGEVGCSTPRHGARRLGRVNVAARDASDDHDRLPSARSSGLRPRVDVANTAQPPRRIGGWLITGRLVFHYGDRNWLPADSHPEHYGARYVTPVPYPDTTSRGPAPELTPHSERTDAQGWGPGSWRKHAFRDDGEANLPARKLVSGAVVGMMGWVWHSIHGDRRARLVR
jgi:hypothetical protein